MNIDKNQIRALIFYWIKSDKRLQNHLQDIQLKILIERIIKGLSFNEMSKIYKTNPKQIQQIFNAVLIRISKRVNKKIAVLLQKMSKDTNEKEQEQHQRKIRFNTIFLN